MGKLKDLGKALKRTVKSKAEIASDMARSKEEQRQRAFVREYLYPFLLEHSTSISDAKNLCMTAVLAVQTAYGNKMRDHQISESQKKLIDLEVVGAIEDPKKYKREADFMHLFDQETVATAEALITGLKNVIESFEREESTKRSLGTLQAELL